VVINISNSSGKSAILLLALENQAYSVLYQSPAQAKAVLWKKKKECHDCYLNKKVCDFTSNT